jgi:hypothetical protein
VDVIHSAQRPAAATLVGLAVLCCAASLSSVLAEEVYRRAESLKEIVGRVDLRRSYGTRLTVVVDCVERPSGCEEEQQYGDLFRFEFYQRTQENREGSTVGYEEPAGAIFMATDFNDADRESFLEEVADTLTGLSAEAFDIPLAGLGPSHPPFDKSTLAPRSIRPTWLCYRTYGVTRAVRFHRHEDESGLRGVGAKHYDIPPTPVCNEIESATRSSFPETHWTLSSPRRMLERVVEHVDAVSLDDDPRSLAARPDGVLLVKQRMVNEGSIDAASVTEDEVTRATHASNGWRYDAWAPPAAMPIGALDQNAWLQAWTVRAVEREFGAEPRSRVLDEATTFVALIPTLPAAAFADDPRPDGSYAVSSSGRLDAELLEPSADEPPRIDRSSFVDQVLEELEAHGGDPQVAIDRSLLRPISGLVSEGWIVVVCEPGGEGIYSLPPTRAGNRVTNAGLFCAALETRLGEFLQ